MQGCRFQTSHHYPLLQLNRPEEAKGNLDKGINNQIPQSVCQPKSKLISPKIKASRRTGPQEHEGEGKHAGQREQPQRLFEQTGLAQI